MKSKNLNHLLISMILAFFTLFQAAGQEKEFVTISGTVKDSNTNKSVAFANIFVPGTHVGTVANLEGKFTIKVHDHLNADKIGISHLGYKVSQFDISSRKGRTTEFILKPHTIILKEVMVKPVDPREIIVKALEKKEENYTTEPHMLTGFYRETVKQKSDYISIAEAVIDIYQSPVTHRVNPNQVKIVQGRKSADVKKADTLILKLQAGPNMAHVLDFVRNDDILVCEKSIDWFNYELSGIVSIEGESNYVIDFEPRVTMPFALTPLLFRSNFLVSQQCF